mmetsp:Transcript_15079/g.32687  ORF Transcript_15079/g.32687 Transcript_15079/m.32687 type:complete len:163 (-) Transcript_15079:10-498(-)|eukprot:CAMPEP_0202920206 /NCGR_PEP_ID=MMETSP1392-20130828/76736_1 /ASSEMBLY_ACC=CAM_ASM_000868 /TAXON_ID=225041 /ORGANISM="Chlamydomonas chlamydogama, Strain SAG 11-48b" /LENGTH=162 /DNA_ID=CAMNT_0049613693 /DNA_START=130 /DNA_END=618 /DNA_ORIENTATION=+
MVRDVDKLDPVPDGKLAQIDKDYLERHQLDKLFNGILTNMIQLKPLDPVQYIIDSVQYGAEYAKQDPKTGLPEHRKNKLMNVFRVMDKEGIGKISFRGLQSYTQKYGGESLGDAELRSIFSDFQPSSSDNLIGLEEFLVFFAKVSRTIPNAPFDLLIKELMG